MTAGGEAAVKNGRASFRSDALSERDSLTRPRSADESTCSGNESGLVLVFGGLSLTLGRAPSTIVALLVIDW
jgi:hypothetical protein